MYLKILTTNLKGKIELTKEELKELLDEAYWEGTKSHITSSWTYKPPTVVSPYYYTTSTTGTVTLNAKDFTNATADTVTESKCNNVQNY